jgi:hypothetical protein
MEACKKENRQKNPEESRPFFHGNAQEIREWMTFPYDRYDEKEKEKIVQAKF